MSSVTNVPITNTTSGVLLTTTTTTPTKEDNNLSAGFQTLNDFYRYVQSNEDATNFPLKHFEPFINTTNTEVLATIGRSKFIAKKTKEAIDQVVDPWKPNAIKDILKFLKHIPFELSNLIDNELGYALKNIKKTAISKNDTEIVALSTKLISEWKELQPQKSNTNANGKRDSPERSPNSSPATEPKKIRLAIQKEPPVRPKAIANPNFFPALVEQKKYRRPVYSVDESNEPTNNKSESVNNNNNNTSSPTITTITTPPPAAATATTTKSNKKKVTFSEKLFEIREYEKNPEEWTIFDNQAPEEIDSYYGSVLSQKPMDIQQHPPPVQFNVPTVPWYSPYVLNFTIDDSLVIPKLIHTSESLSQDTREKLVLAAIYTSTQHIPSSPGEPEEEPDQNINTRVIPLYDVNAMDYQPSPPPLPPQPPHQPVVIQQQRQQPTSNNTLNISPATLSALAAAINNDPKLLPQTQQQQQQQQQTYQPLPASQPQIVQQQQQQTYQPPQPQIVQQPTNVYTPVPFASQQAEISNSTVESMLKNNPGIMNSLKQLSFLAAANSPSTATVQIQQVPNEDTYNETLASHLNNNSSNRGNKNRRRGVGARGRGGIVKGGGIVKRCTYFKSAGGCRNGSQCPYSHDH